MTVCEKSGFIEDMTEQRSESYTEGLHAFKGENNTVVLELDGVEEGRSIGCEDIKRELELMEGETGFKGRNRDKDVEAKFLLADRKIHFYSPREKTPEHLRALNPEAEGEIVITNDGIVNWNTDREIDKLLPLISRGI